MSDIIEQIFKVSNKIRGYPLCHSLPSRSFCYKGRYFGLCARCSAMYFFGILTIILYPLRSGILDPTTSVYFGIILLTPTAVDGGTQFIGLRESNNKLRVTTGTLLGVGIILLSEGIFFYFVI